MSYVIATQQDKNLHFQHFSCYESRGISIERMVRTAVAKYDISKISALDNPKALDAAVNDSKTILKHKLLNVFFHKQT
jgi:hypothetical protein